jgi:hypothetical protein
MNTKLKRSLLFFFFVLTILNGQSAVGNNEPLKEKVRLLAQHMETFFESGLISDDLESFEENHVLLFANEMFGSVQEYEGFIESLRREFKKYIPINSCEDNNKYLDAVTLFVQDVSEHLPLFTSDSPLHCYSQYEENIYTSITEAIINSAYGKYKSYSIHLFTSRNAAKRKYSKCITEKYSNN